MQQAGIKNIVLYENKGVNFVYYDSNNENAITDITNQGDRITIENKQLPEFETKVLIGQSGEILNEYTLKFYILDYTKDILDEIIKIKKSIYGWCFAIEYYDGTYKFYNTPLKSSESEINLQEEMSYEIELKSPVNSLDNFFDYDPDASTLPIYRADTTLLTADITIYTADYAL